MTKFRQDIIRPIIEESDFQLLQKAGLIIFDYTMSPGNQYMFHIPKLVELAKSMTVCGER